MWFLKVKSKATGEYQIIEKNADLMALLKEGDRLVEQQGIEVEISDEKRA